MSRSGILQLTDCVEDASIAMHENAKAFSTKGIDRSIYKIRVFYDFRLFVLIILQAFVTTIFKNSTKEARLLRNDILSLKLRDC